jgi:hypothetical protein
MNVKIDIAIHNLSKFAMSEPGNPAKLNANLAPSCYQIQSELIRLGNLSISTPKSTQLFLMELFK